LDITDWGCGRRPRRWTCSTLTDGISRRLIDAHFHVFTAAEANEFRNILHLGLISLFDVAGASTTTDFRFYAFT
jgi:hypothetical protein